MSWAVLVAIMAFAEFWSEKQGKMGNSFSPYRLFSTHTSAPRSWNQIKFQACSRLVLYLENVLGARHKHVTVRKPPPIPQQSFAFHFLLQLQELHLIEGPAYQPIYFPVMQSLPEKQYGVVQMPGSDAWLISPASKTWLRREQGVLLLEKINRGEDWGKWSEWPLMRVLRQLL